MSTTQYRHENLLVSEESPRCTPRKVIPKCLFIKRKHINAVFLLISIYDVCFKYNSKKLINKKGRKILLYSTRIFIRRLLKKCIMLYQRDISNILQKPRKSSQCSSQNEHRETPPCGYAFLKMKSLAKSSHSEPLTKRVSRNTAVWLCFF